jgi:hypothetical protein
MSINYLIAAWSGGRRLRVMDWKYPNLHPNQTPDLQRPRYTPPTPQWYLEAQLKYLEKLKHNLTQITIINSVDPQEPPAYREYLNNLPKQVQNTPIVLMERENRGYSYGAFSDAFGKYRTSFDYYVLMEDDYVFTQDHFDQTMVEMIEEKPDCGFLADMVCPWNLQTEANPLLRDHAAIFGGLAKAHAMEETWKRQGELSHPKAMGSYCIAGIGGQVAFSLDFLDSGYKLYDWRDRYATCFAHENGQVSWGIAKNGNDVPFMMPVNHHIIRGGFPGADFVPIKVTWPVFV